MSARCVLWWVVLGGMAAPLGCSSHETPPPTVPVQAATGQPGETTQIDEIILERFGHAPNAPFYKVVISRDGTVTYTGEHNVAKVGTFKSTIEREDFRRLEEMLNRFGYFQMQDSYPLAPDAHSVKTAASGAGRRKTIQDGWGSTAPVELWAIEMAIDGLVARITDWKATR
jgi:hypothetical protein